AAPGSGARSQVDDVPHPHGGDVVVGDDVRAPPAEGAVTDSQAIEAVGGDDHHLGPGGGSGADRGGQRLLPAGPAGGNVDGEDQADGAARPFSDGAGAAARQLKIGRVGPRESDAADDQGG